MNIQNGTAYDSVPFNPAKYTRYALSGQYLSMAFNWANLMTDNASVCSLMSFPRAVP